MNTVEFNIDLKKVKELSRLHGSSIDCEGAGGLGIYLWQEKECYCCGMITNNDTERQLYTKKIDKSIKGSGNKNYKYFVVCAGCSKVIRKKFSERISSYDKK